MPEQDYFALMESWGLQGGWPGMTREDWLALVKPPQPSPSVPTAEEIRMFAPSHVPERLLGDVFVYPKLTPEERERIGELRKTADFRLIEDEDIKWLAEVIQHHKGKTYLFGLLARFWEDRSVYKADHGYLTRASGCWRDAKQPGYALACLKSVDIPTNKRLMAIVHTCRAGALRDLRNLEAAEDEAREAILLDDKRPHPYEVLGAICYEKHDFDSGAYFFAQAEERDGGSGPSRKDVLEIIAEMIPSDRQAFAEHLLGSNPKRYAWVKRYTNAEGT